MENDRTQIERQFERWRTRGDGAALGEVFDRLAPGLLRLAIHLVGDAASAEDLVQASFVTAIERAASWDSSRPLEPWLQGILANHARELRRAARRVDGPAGGARPNVDLAAIVARDESTPLDTVLAKEQSAELARALDSVAEPYRAALILRLRHGLKDADIAHVLDRSPGAVRVQLHRGRELLKKLLPAGLVAGVLTIAGTRGLAQIKASVLAKAAVTPYGAAFVGKKIWIAATLLFVLCAAIISLRTSSSATVQSGHVETNADLAVGSTRDGVRAGSHAAAIPSDSGPERARAGIVATASAADDVVLDGRVIDGATSAPVAGAQVVLFAPRRMNVLDVLRRSRERLELMEHNFVSHAWPQVELRAGEAARFGRLDAVVYDAPSAGEEPIARVISDDLGRFTLRAPHALGFVICRAQGYADRKLVARNDHYTDGFDAAGRYVEYPVELHAFTLELERTRRVHGIVVDGTGRPLDRALRFAFDGSRTRSVRRPDDDAGTNSIDTWVVETRADGRFDCELSAPHIVARSLEPELVFTVGALGASNREAHRQFELDGDDRELVLAVQRRPCLVVRDHETRAPIDNFRVFIHDLGGTPCGSGMRITRGGKWPLFPEQHDDASDDAPAWLRTRLVYEVWADGYGPASIEASGEPWDADIVVELVRGETPAIEGRVVDHGAPVAGVSAALVDARTESWRVDDAQVVDAMTTSADGAFQLRAPAGRWVLRLTGRDGAWAHVVELPTAAPVIVDWNDSTSIVARVHDSEGKPLADHCVYLSGLDGRGDDRWTDAEGRATFAHLVAGEYSINVIQGDAMNVTLRSGERLTIELGVNPHKPRRLQLAVDGVSSFDGWSFVAPPTQKPVDLDGTFVFDLAQPSRWLQVQAPDHRSWGRELPSDLPDGYLIHIASAGPGYEGNVHAHIDGKPLGTWRIGVSGSEPSGESSSVWSDDDGHFRIVGLATTATRIALSTREFDHINIASISFEPNAKPAIPPAPIDIELPAIVDTGFAANALTRIRGRLRSTSGDVRSRCFLRIESEEPERDGILRMSVYPDIGPDGRYEVDLLRGARYRAQALDRHTQKPLLDSAWAASGDVEERDLDLP